MPDGLTIDAEGGLWVALWSGGAVHRYLHGLLDRVIELPVSQPTSCTFGGDDFDELFVTSASDGLSAGSARRSRSPARSSVCGQASVDFRRPSTSADLSRIALVDSLEPAP